MEVSRQYSPRQTFVGLFLWTRLKKHACTIKINERSKQKRRSFKEIEGLWDKQYFFNLKNYLHQNFFFGSWLRNVFFCFKINKGFIWIDLSIGSSILHLLVSFAPRETDLECLDPTTVFLDRSVVQKCSLMNPHRICPSLPIWRKIYTSIGGASDSLRGSALKTPTWTRWTTWCY